MAYKTHLYLPFLILAVSIFGYSQDTIREYYNNGKIKSANIITEKNKFILLRYDEEENVFDKTEYSNNKKHGQSSFDTLISGERTHFNVEYKEGYLHGRIIISDSNNTVRFIGEYFESNKNGYQRLYDNKGNLLYIEYYKNDKKDSIQTYYFPDSIGTTSVQFSKLLYGNELVDEKHYGKNKEEIYSNGKIINAYYFYNTGILKSDCEYGNNRRDYSVSTYDELGRLNKIVVFKNDKLNGICKYYIYNEDQTIDYYVTEFRNGKKYGTEDLYINKILKRKYIYENDVLHGISKEYYQNGDVKILDTYKKGIKINRKMYDVNGKLEFNQDYPLEYSRDYPYEK